MGFRKYAVMVLLMVLPLSGAFTITPSQDTFNTTPDTLITLTLEITNGDDPTTGLMQTRPINTSGWCSFPTCYYRNHDYEPGESLKNAVVDCRIPPINLSEPETYVEELCIYHGTYDCVPITFNLSPQEDNSQLLLLTGLLGVGALVVWIATQ